MLNLLFKKIINNYKIFTSINLIIKKKPRFIFYSENKSYQKYTYLLIKLISKKYPGEVYYVSSDIDDKILDNNIINIFIGSSFLRVYFFNFIKTENIFLTLTDLGNHFIKKSKNVKRYIYYFHSPISTTKSYTQGAFDNYDLILCNGEYQYNEIRKRESHTNTNMKQLLKTGYFYFDYLAQKIQNNEIPDEILIAPSWNYGAKNFVNMNFENIIEVLLKKNFIVRFRPHPELFKRSKTTLEKIKKKFINAKFIFDEDVDNCDSMQKAKCLITDNSGIAIEYLLLFKKPVLYFEDLDKIHNKNYKDFSDFTTIEDNLKVDFGKTFTLNDLDVLDVLINSSISEFKNKEQGINYFIKNNFYNFSQVVNKSDTIMNKIF
tara:strand:+ start:1508 stop:2635 length:1128 start_codon:yes stop_codon:yes gene_type:complete